MQATEPTMVHVIYRGANAPFPYEIYSTTRPHPDFPRIWKRVAECGNRHAAIIAADKARADAQAEA